METMGVVLVMMNWEKQKIETAVYDPKNLWADHSGMKMS